MSRYVLIAQEVDGKIHRYDAADIGEGLERFHSLVGTPEIIRLTLWNKAKKKSVKVFDRGENARGGIRRRC